MSKLKEMDSEGFERMLSNTKERYKNDKIRANGFTENEACQIAEKDIKRALPGGRKTKDARFFSIINQESVVIGHLWFGFRGSENNRKGYIYDIFIKPKHRGRGHARAALNELEEFARKHQLKGIGLHAFAFNREAIGLYESLGYLTTDVLMEKSLD